jgi:hypothetical protein
MRGPLISCRTGGCEEVVGIRFALDSSLEQTGFEPSVPPYTTNFQEAAVCHLGLPHDRADGRVTRTNGGGSNYARREKKRQHPKMCEVAHTSKRIGKAIRHAAPRSLGSVGDTEGAMPRYHLWWCRILPRIELDHRSREARLQLERIEWLLIPPAAGKRRLFRDGRGGDGTLQSGRIRRLLKARSSRVPPIVETRGMEMVLSQVSP